MSAYSVGETQWTSEPARVLPSAHQLRQLGDIRTFFSPFGQPIIIDCDPQHYRLRLGFVHIDGESADFYGAHTPHASVEPCCGSHMRPHVTACKASTRRASGRRHTS